MHHMCRAKDIDLKPAYGGNSLAYTRASLIDHTVGSVHTGFGLCALGQGGHVGKHVHSFEEGFYVLEGKPRIVLRDTAYELAPGTCGVVPVGVPHAWIAPENEGAKWIDMLAPQPRPQGVEQDTFFLGEPDVLETRELDIRDPRNKNFFKMAENDIDLDKLKVGSRIDTPQVSASMATALLAYSGIAVKMLADHRLDAHLMTMFMVEYQPGGVAHPHDHPLEETYYMLEGKIEAWADGQCYNLRPGDVFWSGVGCIHAFYNKTDTTVRWLETSSPAPPPRHSYRFNRDWAYLKEKLGTQA